MDSWLLFLLKSTLSLSLLYLAFSILMRKETFFMLNRMTLLFIVIISAIIPFLYSPQPIQPIIPVRLEPIFTSNTIIEEPAQQPEIPVTIQPSVPVSETKQPIPISARTIFLFAYLSGVFVSFLILIHSIISVLLLFLKARKTDQDGIRLMIVDEDIPAFSFGRYILISQHDYNTNPEAIITHEQSHIRLGHFYDLILMELVKIIYWFNPLIYHMVRALKEIQEFQADDHTLSKGIDATKYQLLIIRKCVGHQKFALANSFNHCQIKNRITMMNKQKTSKAWRWKVATFLPLLALLLVFCGRNGGNEPPTNSVQIKDQMFSINRCEIANESFDNTSKFEVDLLIGKKDNNLNDTTNEKNVIWFSIASKNVSDITEGEYHFSSKSINKRAAMTFSGAVWVENKKMDITEGDLMCKRDPGKINISFNLKVDKEKELKGTYSGSFVYISTREKTLAQKIPVKEQMPEMKVDTNALVIRFKNDGNYINNKLYSRDDFIKEVKAWTKVDVKSRGALIVSGKDFELSDSRNTEITAISNATGISFVPTLGIDQQAVFPGGNSAMFEWIKQNAKYPIQDAAYGWSKDVVVSFVVNIKGKTVDARIVKSRNPEMDAEALRVVSQMPEWKPAMKNGLPVNVERRISIPFKFK